jgi:long-subunit fatty acid transport protein
MTGRASLILLILVLAAQPGPAQTRYTTDVSAGAMFPTGTPSPFFKTGLALNLGFSMQSGDGLRYHLGLGYDRTSIDNQALNDDPDTNPGGGKFEVGGTISAFPVLVGLTFMSSSAGARPYAVLEAGVYLYSKKFDGGTYTYPDGTVITLSSSSSFKVEPGVNVGLGVRIPMDAAKSLDLAARYHLVKDSQVYTSPTGAIIQAGQFFSLTAGLSFSFTGP